jgi:hypothetical protein
MTDITKTGNIATTQHQMKESHRATSAFNGRERNSAGNDTLSADSRSDIHVRNFITYYQDILVVNIKCI